MITWWMLIGPIFLLLYALIVHFTSQGLRRRTAAFVGGGLFLWSFFILPWITTTLDCLGLLGTEANANALISSLGIAPTAASAVTGAPLLLALADAAWIMAQNPPGFLLSFYYPALNLDLMFLILLWMPVFYAVFVIICGLLSLTTLFTGIQKFLGSLIFVVGLFIVLPIMVIQLPAIDAWGTQGQFIPSVTAVVVGTRLGWGAWLALLFAVPMMILSGERLYVAAQMTELKRGIVVADDSAPLVSAVLNVPGKVWTIIGAMLFLISFFFLPWINYAPTALATNLAALNTLAGPITDPLCMLQGLDAGCSLYQDPWPFTSTKVQALRATLATGQSFSGLGIVSHLFTTNLALTMTMIGGLTLSILLLVWSVIFLMQFNNKHDQPMNRLITGATWLIAGVLGLATLVLYPDMETFGAKSDFQISLLMATAQAWVGTGATIGIIGLFLMAMGGLREVPDLMGGPLDFSDSDSMRFVVYNLAPGLLAGVVLGGTMLLGREPAGLCGFTNIAPTVPNVDPTVTPTAALPTQAEQFQSTPNSTSTVVLQTGDVQITLRWPNADNYDLDLHVIDPNGSEIYFQEPSSPSGGQLDVDDNFQCEASSSEGVENIFWPPSAAPRGHYRVFVHHYPCGDTTGIAEFRVIVTIDGQVIFDDMGSVAYDQMPQIFEFDYGQ